jgi:hypothetical protein
MKLADETNASPARRIERVGSSASDMAHHLREPMILAPSQPNSNEVRRGAEPRLSQARNTQCVMLPGRSTSRTAVE